MVLLTSSLKWELFDGYSYHLGCDGYHFKGILVIKIGIERGESLNLKVGSFFGAGINPIVVFRLDGYKSLERFIEITTITDAFTMPDGFKKFSHRRGKSEWI